jgi:ABC-2 type transport system ATP-binding protein
MFGWMTVGEILGFLAPFYPTWDRQLAQRYVERFELPAETRIKHLSKGQNVRLGLILALAHRPELVILDDPALGLDPIMRKDFNRPDHIYGRGSQCYSSHLSRVGRLPTGGILKDGSSSSRRPDLRERQTARISAELADRER